MEHVVRPILRCQVKANAGRAASVTHQRYVFLVPAENFDVVFYPIKRRCLIHQPEIPLRFTVEGREEPQDIQSVRDGDDNDVLLEHKLEGINFEGTSVAKIAGMEVGDNGVAFFRRRSCKCKRKMRIEK